MYAMVSTRPDIAFRVSRVAKVHQQIPRISFETAIKRIFHYLAGTPTMGISYFVLSHTSLSKVIVMLIMLGTTMIKNLVHAIFLFLPTALLHGVVSGKVALQTPLQKRSLLL